MKAIVRTRYGPPDVIEVKDFDKPTPTDNEVLVKVHAASLNKADLFDLHPPFVIRMVMGGGVLKPKDRSLGRDLSGSVELVGRAVTRFKPGDEVFGTGPGALAEYAVAREDRLTLKPPGVSFEDCAATPVAGVTALQGLRKGQIKAGQKVLIDGASGGVGTFTLQIAKSFGTKVTAVCSAPNIDSARAMGADQVIDYSKEDFTKTGQTYDLIAGVNGFHSVPAIRRSLAPGGAFVLLGSSKALTGLLQVALLGRLASGSGKRIGFMGIAKIVPEDLATLGELMGSGKLKPFIDRRYPLSEAAEAFQYLQEGHARGKVVVKVAD
ncbi:MAG TPA: NAD(P)-dependent alcohol dehydrogenase [Nitrososphaerales archaeon]|nr:NAD(P)-dependent alcohol dehydrogenase [Nitrososphaerales archaeon]